MILSGRGVSEGIAIGPVLYIEESRQTVKKYIKDEQKELIKFDTAVKMAVVELDELKNKTAAKQNKEISLILDAHRMLLMDEEYTGQIRTLIVQEKICAQWAIDQICDRYVAMFQEMDNEYMHARALDIKDISKKMQKFLDEENVKENETDEKRSYIIAANELTASDTMKLNPDRILAFVTNKGSVNSHVSIVAKSMGVPALVGIDMSQIKDESLEYAIVDADKGCFITEPAPEILENYRCILKERNISDRTDVHGEEEAVITDVCMANGRPVMVGANIGSFKECIKALEAGCDAIGLVRSEFLYMSGSHAPTEDEQLQIYKSILMQMGEKEVVIRTLDIGADKCLPYIQQEKEENPALGIRGVRLSLNNEVLFKTQLRALIRASVYGNLSIMYPMISSAAELERIKEIVHTITDELKKEGCLVNKFRQGIMIETPSAALCSDELAKRVDFFSIGTNDLTQYTYACDRQNDKVWEYIDEDYSAVFKLIEMTVENAHKNGIKAGVCGELAANTKYTEKLLHAGVDELSAVPSKIQSIKKKIRS